MSKTPHELVSEAMALVEAQDVPLTARLIATMQATQLDALDRMERMHASALEQLQESSRQTAAFMERHADRCMMLQNAPAARMDRSLETASQVGKAQERVSALEENSWSGGTNPPGGPDLGDDPPEGPVARLVRTKEAVASDGQRSFEEVLGDSGQVYAQAYGPFKR